MTQRKMRAESASVRLAVYMGFNDTYNDRNNMVFRCKH